VDVCEKSVSLKKRLAKLLEDFDAFTGETACAAITGADEKAARATLAVYSATDTRQMLQNFPLPPCLHRHDDLIAAAELNHTEDRRARHIATHGGVSLITTRGLQLSYLFRRGQPRWLQAYHAPPEGIPQPKRPFRYGCDGNIGIDTENTTHYSRPPPQQTSFFFTR